MIRALTASQSDSKRESKRLVWSKKQRRQDTRASARPGRDPQRGAPTERHAPHHPNKTSDRKNNQARGKLKGAEQHTLSTTGSESVWPMVMRCRNAIRQQRGYQWGGGVIVWGGIGQENGRQSNVSATKFSRRRPCSLPMTLEKGLGWSGPEQSRRFGCSPASDSFFAFFCFGLGFPFFANPASLGGLMLLVHGGFLVVESGVAGALPAEGSFWRGNLERRS